MKRLILLAVLVVAFAGAYALGTTSTKIRVAGSNTVSGDFYYIACDSSDTFVVDTVYSDTLTIDDTKDQLVFYVSRGHVAIADSCNDSVVIAVSVFTQSGDGMIKKVWSATMDADTLADTNSCRLFIGGGLSSFTPDSMVVDKIWFETVVSDSFIMGSGGIDSIQVPIVIHAVQR